MSTLTDLQEIIRRRLSAPVEVGGWAGSQSGSQPTPVNTRRPSPRQTLSLLPVKLLQLKAARKDETMQPVIDTYRKFMEEATGG
jgi:hypothetical protein